MTAAKPGVGLLDGLLNAPLAGIVTRQRRRPRVLHAITLDGFGEGFLAEPRRAAPFTAACGETGLKLYAGLYREPETRYPLLWPPGVKGLPEYLVRCKECHQATGRMRPRCWFKAASLDAKTA